MEKRKPYEKPALVPLDGDGTELAESDLAQISGGNGTTDYCRNGSGPQTQCTSGTNAINGDCGHGYLATGHQCKNGNCAYYTCALGDVVQAK